MRRALALAVVAGAAWVSLSPRPAGLNPGDYLPNRTDLLAHVALHAVVACAVALAWPPGRRRMAVIVALAVGLEVGQALVPGRSAAMTDLGANLLGAALGATAATLYARKVRFRRSSSSAIPSPGASVSASAPPTAESGESSG